MRISIAAIGRMKSGPETELVARYLERARGTGKTLGLTDFDVIEHTESRAGSASARKADEAKLLTNALSGATCLIALDERGKSFGSEDFANWIANRRDMGEKHIGIMIGGADGLDADLRKRADLVLSFSPLTWPHQLVRIMLAEQLYRATTILSNHPYHRA
jgi:23S rRNA (pseudouridine1915-N3)-methyltransferase